MERNEPQQADGARTAVLPYHTVYESLCSKINLRPVNEACPLEAFQDNDLLAESSADERLARAMGVFLNLISEGSRQVDRLDKSLLDFHIGRLDRRISRQLDAVMHARQFQALESRWRGLKFTVDRTDFRKNAQIELLDVSKDALLRDFEDTPEIVQSGLYRHTYIEEYDTPGGQPISAMISDYEFTNSPQDIGLLRNLSKVAAAAVRVYQLKDRKLFDAASYSDLLTNDKTLLAQDLQASTAAVVNPGAAMSFSTPIQADTTYVAIVAFYREPSPEGQWRTVIPKKKLSTDKPLKLELIDRTLVAL